MEQTQIAKAVGMFNLLHSDTPITETQATNLLRIWEMVSGQPAPLATAAPQAPQLAAPVAPAAPEEPEPPKPEPEPQPAPVPEKMPRRELLTIPPRTSRAMEGQLIPKDVDKFETDSSRWHRDFEYRIAVTPRAKSFPLPSARFIYFRDKPSQDEFDAEYLHFQKGTHNVHVHYRTNVRDYRMSETLTITDEYCSWRHQNVGCYGDTFDVDPRWTELEARFRIKYKNKGALANAEFRYVYYQNCPTHDIVSDYERRHGIALLQKRDHVLELEH